jgi:predicted nucleic acid-binding protein
LFFLEMASALGSKPRASEETVAKSLAKLWDLRLRWVEAKKDLVDKTNAISYGYKTSIYDSSYVAVAESTGFPLVTADGELLRRMKGHSMVLPVWELEFPAAAGS